MSLGGFDQDEVLRRASTWDWSKPWNTRLSRNVLSDWKETAPPMGIKKRLVVEAHELANQVAKRGIRNRRYQAPNPAEKFRKLVGRQSHLGNDPEGADTTALQCPEEIGICRGVGNECLAVWR